MMGVPPRVAQLVDAVQLRFIGAGIPRSGKPASPCGAWACGLETAAGALGGAPSSAKAAVVPRVRAERTKIWRSRFVIRPPVEYR
jgi:hypothetical protein